jgi:type VI secretion system protein ImpH
VLEALIEGHFQMPAHVEQFHPEWYPLDEADQTRLGVANCGLGEDIVVGTTVRLSQAKFDVVLGPLDWDQFQEMLPNARGFPALVDLVRLAVGSEFEFEIRLVLKKEDVPEFKLPAERGRHARLGWSTWLCSEPLGSDPDDVFLNSESIPFSRQAGAARNPLEARL